MRRNFNVELSFNTIDLMTEFVNELNPEKTLILNCIEGSLIDKDFLQSDKKVDVISLYLEERVVEEGFLSELYTIEKDYNLIVVFPPINCKVNIESKGYYRRREFVDSFIAEKLLDKLDIDGELFIITTESFLTSPHNQYRRFRENIKNNYTLKMVANLNNDSLLNARVSLYLTVIKNEKKHGETILISKHQSNEYIIQEYSSPTKTHLINQDDIKERWDPNFYDREYTKLDKKLNLKNYSLLWEISDVMSGDLIRNTSLMKYGKYKVFSLRDVNRKDADANHVQELEENMKELNPGDILISRIYPNNSSSRNLYIVNEKDLPAVANHNLVVIRPKNDKYLTTYLNTSEGRTTFFNQLNRYLRGANVRRISINDLKEIKIPIIPIKDLTKVTDAYISEEKNKDELNKLRHELELVQQNLEYQIRINVDKADQIENLNAQLRFMNNRFDAIDSQLLKIDEKLDEILKEIKQLGEEFKVIKSLNTDEKEIIKFLEQKIDETIGKIIDQGFEMYIEMVKLWINPNWNKLEDLSKDFLPSAELLYSQINKVENSDPSPYIIQYCRALEHELLEKIFRPYLKNLKERSVNIKEQFSFDLEVNENGKPKNRNRNSFDFANLLLRLENKKESEWFFELGRMSFILQKLTSSKVDNSPLLTDFKKFILDNFNEKFIDRKYYENISNLTREYRNRAAHPNVIDRVEAEYGKEKVKNILKSMLDMYK